MKEIEFLKKVLDIYSPTGEEKELTGFLLSEIKKNRFEGYIDKAGNVILRKNSKGKKILLLCSHLDTVAGKINVREENGRIYGRGAVDAKGPLTSMFLAAMGSNPKNIQLIFCGTVAEEADSKGIKEMMKHIKADYAVFGEPSGINKLAIGYKGIMIAEKEFKKERRHSSNFEQKNAIEEALDEIEQLKKRIKPYEKEGYFDRITIRPMRMDGDSASCKLVLNVRFPPSVSLDEMLDLFDGFTITGEAPGVLADKKNATVITMRKAIKNVMGKGALLIKKTGTCDANDYFDVCKNIVVYGPGESALDHTSNENIDAKEFLTAIQVYKKFIQMVDESL